MSARVNSHQPFSENRLGFTVLNDRGKPALIIIYPNKELHDAGLADFKRVIKDAELIFPPSN